VELSFNVDGRAANTVTINIKWTVKTKGRPRQQYRFRYFRMVARVNLQTLQTLFLVFNTSTAKSFIIAIVNV
jgi:hypothetical protein